MCLSTQNLANPSHLDGTQTASISLCAGVDEFIVHYAFEFVTCFGGGLVVPFLSTVRACWSWGRREEDAARMDGHGLIGQDGAVRSVGREARDVGVEAG
jgi:hypothetical protein